MEFKHMRGSALILFDKLTKIPGLIAVVMISLFFIKQIDFEELLLPIILLLFSPLSGVTKYISTYYTLEDDQLIINTGIIKKKRLHIPFRQITTVDLSQNILYQLCKTYRIKIDNASQTGDSINKAEVLLALKEDKAFEFKRIITQETVAEIVVPVNTKVITASPQEFIKLGCLQSKLLYFFTGGPIAVPIITTIAALITGAKNEDELLDKLFNLTLPGVAIFRMITFFYLISLAISLISSILTYYHFKISSDEDKLKIEYGLLMKKKFILPKSKINGILLKQNLLMRIFNCYTTEILVIGYGDKSDDEVQKKPIIYPIATMEKIISIAKELLPDYELVNHIYRPERKAFRYFFYRLGFIIAVLIFIIVLFTRNYISIFLAGILPVIAAISVLLQYHNTGIYCGRNNITLSFGGYHKTIAFIKSTSIESITVKSSILKRKKGIVTIRVGFLAPLHSANLTVLNLPIEQYQLLVNELQY